MIYKEDINSAKRNIEDNIGKKIRLKQRGSKSKTKDGILIEAYNSLFLVSVRVDSDIYLATTFTYKDLITENVVITLK